MEVFILDSLLRRIDVVDEYISFIWTERFSAKGDFQLVTLATNANRNRFVPDTLLSINDSKRLMRVNTIEDTIDTEQGATLTVKGFELVSILEQRVMAIMEAGGIPTTMIRPIAYFSGGTTLDLINTMVWMVCAPSSPWALNPGDIIPFLQDYTTSPPSLYPPSNLPIPGAGGITWAQKVASLYSAVSDAAKAYDIGFRLYKDPDSSKLYFEPYAGCDRTTAQNDYAPVVFSSDMQNLQNTTEYIDNNSHFNVVIAIYEYPDPLDNEITLTIHEIVSDPELLFSSGGFDQKTKFITITQLPAEITLATAPAYLQQLAQEELTRSRPTDVIDGEVDPNADFLYERDYYLGDIVEVRSDNGGAAYMRVEEQIIKFDSNGKSSYPSLVSKTSISPGTWASWKYDVDWEDMGSGEFWSNQ